MSLLYLVLKDKKGPRTDISPESLLDELIRASQLLSNEFNLNNLMSILAEQALDITRSDLACLYFYTDAGQAGEAGKKSDLRLMYRRGTGQPPKRLPKDTEFLDFLEDSKESLVILDRNQVFFRDLFLQETMNSAVALPLFTPKARIGVLIVNAEKPNFYNRERFSFLDSFTKLAAGMLHNTRLFEELKEKLRQVEALERYQENVFNSMTNLLVTTDSSGNVHYFNRAAAERLGLNEEDLGRDFEVTFTKAIDKKILKQIRKSEDAGIEVLGSEGIIRREAGDIDFSLNVSPLKGKRGRREGLTLLFTDQTRERELKEQMDVAVEQRRVIKDMFARYLSIDVVENLMAEPDLVKLGGDKKTATIFFADIRGYTSFSEKQEPEYIIEVLNEYFTEAVEVIIEHKGYIDKFIGDAIMAAWGVPMATIEEDAYEAVSCALEIQDKIKSKDRNFFQGAASKLKVGIGMHTGPLVAGNLGSSRRMDYSVIGDTVNVAARLEGVAGGGEVVITDKTYDLLGGSFKVKEMAPVTVKGKKAPLRVFSVLDIIK